MLSEKLTDRENEVLDLIIAEFSTKEVAEKLHISVRTVEAHRMKIIQKVGGKNIIRAIKLKLMERMLTNEKP